MTDSLKDVLANFAREYQHNPAALALYIRRYPQHAVAIASMAVEAHRAPRPTPARPLLPEERDLNQEAWERFLEQKG